LGARLRSRHHRGRPPRAAERGRPAARQGQPQVVSVPTGHLPTRPQRGKTMTRLRTTGVDCESRLLVAGKVLAELLEGETIETACARAGVDRGTYYRWRLASDALDTATEVALTIGGVVDRRRAAGRAVVHSDPVRPTFSGAA